ncbi:MAG: hypothetical protein QOH14_3903 [Pseudonocardiales bacterium]|nr:hypothetical protein [Pseudonocardiales bacterium]
MDALAGLMPTAEAYARLPLADAFNWSDCEAAIERGEWYMVAFRSTIRPDADTERLREYDDFAHVEASGSPGFVHYYKGPLAGDGTCLSFCLWTSRADARAASRLPAHLEAVALIAETYAEYTLEFISMCKADAGAAITFAPYDTVPALQAIPGPQLSPVALPAPLGFSPAAS